MLLRRARLLPCALALVVPLASNARAQSFDPNACDAPGDAPDVIVGNLHELKNWGRVGDITGFSIGTYSCNIGTCWLDWIAGTNNENQHPTIGQNMFRLKDGRFEQLGQSWMKHGFFALSRELCETGCIPTDGEHLGVNCSDPYTANNNGTQTRLGPKWEVDVASGSHPHPVTDQSLVGDEIFKRLQVHDADLDPALNAGARYYVEGQYVAEDDHAAGNEKNNASYREVSVSVRGPDFDLAFAAPTQITKPGILAWQDADPDVQVVTVDDADRGRFYIAAKATDLGGGTWHYEYAVQNLDSARAAGRFSVPVPPGAVVSGIGFHDVDYHSGEPFDLTDWTDNGGGGGAVTWQTVDHAVDANANALRWGTLYNFRFDLDRAPGTGLLRVGLFKPAGPGEAGDLVAPMIVPDACNSNGACDPGEDCVSCPGECPDAGPDNDGDGVSYCVDCDDNAPGRWATPGEVVGLLVHRGSAGEMMLDWSRPIEPGATRPAYDVLRSNVASDFATNPACVPGGDPTASSRTDFDILAGGRLFYLVRARSTCALGVGTSGTDSFGTLRLTASCP